MWLCQALLAVCESGKCFGFELWLHVQDRSSRREAGHGELQSKPQAPSTSLSIHSLEVRLVLLALVNQRLVDVGNHTTSCNGSLDEGVELLISTNGELEMTGSDTLHFKVL